MLGELFFGRNGGLTSLADLARATGVSQASVSREMDRLEAAGLVTSTRHGRHRLVSANTDSPYFGELRALLLKAVGAPYTLATLLGAVPGVEEAYIFGSWAARYHGSAGSAPNDIDVLVVGDVDHDAVYGACREAERALRLDVNPVVRTPEQWRGGDSTFLDEVRRGPLVPVVRK